MYAPKQAAQLLLLVLCLGWTLAEEEKAQSAGTSRLEQFLAGLRIKTVGQTPADTSLLQQRQRTRSSGLRVKASGQTPADTSLLPPRPRSGSPAHVALVSSAEKAPAAAAAAGRQTPANVGLLQQPREEGVRRRETSSFKDLNGESVRVVVGNYGYDSPEGLPVSFEYMSDENGNQASFAIGKPTTGGGASTSKGSSKPPSTSGPAGASGKTPALATPGGADRNYLPPK